MREQFDGYTFERELENFKTIKRITWSGRLEIDARHAKKEFKIHCSLKADGREKLYHFKDRSKCRWALAPNSGLVRIYFEEDSHQSLSSGLLKHSSRDFCHEPLDVEIDGSHEPMFRIWDFLLRSRLIPSFEKWIREENSANPIYN